MLYAASSRRSTVRIQRQISSRGSQTRNLFGIDYDTGLPPQPTSANTTRPNTANSFQHNGKRPSTPYKSSNSGGLNRINVIRDTFMLDDHDLQHFFRSFCFIAKQGDLASPSKSSSTAPKKRERQNMQGDALHNPAYEKVPTIDDPVRPWEEKDAARITLSISEFFATFQLSHTSNGGFLDGIFDLVGTKDLHATTFGEFLDGVCTFGMFKLDDIIRFIFFVLDKEKEGRIPRFQLLRFVESIHGKKIRAFEQVILPEGNNAKPSSSYSSSLPSNKGGNPLRLPAAERRRATVDYLALQKLCVDYPSMMEPILLIQNDIRRRIMGEVWWRRKENQIDKYFRTLPKRREKTRRREEKRLLKERKQKILSEIGRKAYYFRSNSRDKAEEEYPKPIVSLEEESGKIRVEWTRTDGEGKDDDSDQTA
mmetsp:Transcript_13664/g.29565  ORF Transcript_13664/g.29565 Transcript_13664/m.29565 type:complete len:423 (-) Transcript_13664:569-1837(-)